MVEQSQTIFQTQHTGYCIVDAFHRYLSFFNQLFQIIAETHFVWNHRHVDTGIDGNLDSLFLGGSDVIPGTEIVNVRPVCNNQSVPVQVFFQPFGQQLTVGVKWQSVVNTGVYHYAQCTLTYSGKERSEMFFTHITA